MNIGKIIGIAFLIVIIILALIKVVLILVKVVTFVLLVIACMIPVAVGYGIYKLVKWIKKRK